MKTEKKNGKALSVEPTNRIKDVVTLAIPKTAYSRLKLRIRGTTILVVNQFKQQIEALEGSQTGAAKGGRKKKDPKALFEQSIYRDNDGHPALPTCAFKKALINATDFKADRISAGKVSGCLRVEGYWTRIHGSEPKMRRDWVRNASGVVDLRYRAEFETWECELSIKFESDEFSPAQVLNLVRKAGTRIGCFEGRPEKESALDWGTFEIVPDSVTFEEYAE